MSRFVKESFFGTLAAASSTISSFLSGVVVARLLGIEGSGSYALAVWVIAMTTTATGLGLPSTLSRYLPELTSRAAGEEDGCRLAASLLRYSIAANSLPMAVAAGYSAWLVVQPSGAEARHASMLADPVAILLLGASCAAQALGDFAKGYLRGRRQLGLVAKLTGLAALLQLTLMVAGSCTLGIRGALVGYLAGALLSALPLLRFWRIPAGMGPALRRRIARYAAFRWLSETTSVFVFARSELLFLQLFWGVTSVGLLSVSLTLANMAVQGPLMMTWGLLPRFSEHVGRGDFASLADDYATGLRLMAFLIFPACFGLAALVPELLPLLFGTAFDDAIPAAQILVCGSAIAAIGTVGANLIWAVERSDVDLYVGLFGALVSVAGGLLLIAPFGLTGAALSRTLTQVSAISVGTWFLAVRYRSRVPLAALGRLALSAVVCAASARLALAFVHGWPGLGLAVTAGAGTYFAAVRSTQALDPADVRRIGSLFRRVPAPFDGATRRMVRLALG